MKSFKEHLTIVQEAFSAKIDKKSILGEITDLVGFKVDMKNISAAKSWRGKESKRVLELIKKLEAK